MSRYSKAVGGWQQTFETRCAVSEAVKEDYSCSVLRIRWWGNCGFDDGRFGGWIGTHVACFQSAASDVSRDSGDNDILAFLSMTSAGVCWEEMLSSLAGEEGAHGGGAEASGSRLTLHNSEARRSHLDTAPDGAVGGRSTV